MTKSRPCSRTACTEPAAATLTYVYADQTVVVGPLAAAVEPHGYDLCAVHSQRVTAPRGWNVVRLAIDANDPTGTGRDIAALADAVRTGRRRVEGGESESPEHPDRGTDHLDGRRSHLRVVRDG